MSPLTLRSQCPQVTSDGDMISPFNPGGKKLSPDICTCKIQNRTNVQVSHFSVLCSFQNTKSKTLKNKNKNNNNPENCHYSVLQSLIETKIFWFLVYVRLHTCINPLKTNILKEKIFLILLKQPLNCCDINFSKGLLSVSYPAIC